MGLLFCLGGTIKGGANWNIDAKNNVYVNSGYYSKAPNFDAVYQDNDQYLTPDADLNNEKVFGLEAGYGYRSSDFNLNLNLYRTSWKDHQRKFAANPTDRVGYSLQRG